MLLYKGTAASFVEETCFNRIVETMIGASLEVFGRRPGPSEIHSWQNSLRMMALVTERMAIADSGVAVEYQLPGTSRRLDVMYTGHNGAGNPQAVIVELKQWEKCSPGEGDKVVTFVAQRDRDVLHPSVQVDQYKQYLRDQNTAFQEQIGLGYDLASCAFLHNYEFLKNDPLLDEKFDSVLKESPLYGKRDVQKLIEFLKGKIKKGEGEPVLDKILKAPLRPSRKLLLEVNRVIKEKSEYILIDNQVVAFNRIMVEAKKSIKSKKDVAIIVKGGPGTGKSVIALNVMAELARMGKNVHYATGSKAFTETLRKIVGTRASQQIKYFNSYSTQPKKSLDVLICDEAHRIRITSNSRFTPKSRRSSCTQTEELFDVAKTLVFFIDDKQVVRPAEIGNSREIYEFAARRGIKTYEIELSAQFRCQGSDGFVNWVNHTLQIEETANTVWVPTDLFDFQIFDSPEKLEAAIKMKVDCGNTGRVTAGFCWEWSDPDSSGNLLNDVVIGGFQRPWDAKPGAGRLAKGIPSASLWAHDPNGINQIGCVYTAQGFEFDYVGVIFGKDLVYRKDKGWVGQKEESHDVMVKRSKEQFSDFIKNAYRVLLTRGIKGCYIYFMDDETRHYFESRIVTNKEIQKYL
jgi:DUF2075 family protein